MRDGRRWTFEPGPFRRADFKSLPARNWTLLVQGVNLHDAAADALLRRFSFLPYARLDDLMVSYAAPGGGVGPHFDSYDVFLLQGFGRRRWRYGPQDDLELKPGLPVKILRRFAPAHDDVLVPGDMLYLPPQLCARRRRRRHVHDLLDRLPRARRPTNSPAPSSTSCATRSTSTAATPTPTSRPPANPRESAPRCSRRCARELGRLAWTRSTVARFLGCWLSEPKPTVFFDPPPRPRPLRRVRAARSRATALASTGARSSSTTTGSCSSTAARTPGRTTAPASRHCGGSPTNASLAARRGRGAVRRPAWPSSTSGTAMATSTPPPADAAHPRSRPSPCTQRLDTLAAQVAAIDRLVELARLSIRVFDGDLAQTGWNSVARTERLAALPARLAPRPARDHRPRHTLDRGFGAAPARPAAPVQPRDDDLPDRRRAPGPSPTRW